MKAVMREFSISRQVTLAFEPCLDFLRQALIRNGFLILAELPFHREFPRRIGMPANRKHTVLVAWSPFHAYQALLNEPEAGVFVPFNFVVADNGEFTSVACTNHLLFGRMTGTIGTLILSRSLVREIRMIFAELEAREKVAVKATVQGERQEAS